MANGITTAFWSMTINNPTETDLALVQTGYPDFLRELVHTLEVGEEGTPHIQAWIKLQRQQRMSFVKKLFPRAKLIPLTSDEYNANTKKYAQKLDETSVSAAVHRFNDPMHTIETVIRRVIARVSEVYTDTSSVYNDHELDQVRNYVQKQLVAEDFKFAKIFVSSTYKTMWREFGEEMFENLLTHTHTHTQTVNLPVVDINAKTSNNSERSENDSHSGRSNRDSDEESQSSEAQGWDESGSVSGSSSYDS